MQRGHPRHQVDEKSFCHQQDHCKSVKLLPEKKAGWKEGSMNIQLKGISSALFRPLRPLGEVELENLKYSRTRTSREGISLWCSPCAITKIRAADPARRRTLSNCCVISLGQLNGLQTVTLMNRCRSAGKLLFTVSCAPPPHQPNGGITSSGQQYPSHGPQPPLVRSFQEETFPVAVSTNRRGSPTN